MPKDFIAHEAANIEAWVCLCGNQPDADGFYPCDAIGHELEPHQGSGWAGLYVFVRCGRIIKQDTLEVVGSNPNSKFLA